jgi:hypothetical protein
MSVYTEAGRFCFCLLHNVIAAVRLPFGEHGKLKNAMRMLSETTALPCYYYAMIPLRLRLACLLVLQSAIANAQSASETSTNAQSGIVPPEIVHVEKQSADAETRYATVGNDTGHYWLFCNIKGAGCISLEPGKNYYLFNSRTRWKLPGAKEFMTLSFIQDWTSIYGKGVSLGLVPEDGNGDMGMFLLDTFGAGHQLDTVLADGPIQYGAGLNDADRKAAWKYFFLMFAETLPSNEDRMRLEQRLASGVSPVGTTVSLSWTPSSPESADRRNREK